MKNPLLPAVAALSFMAVPGLVGGYALFARGRKEGGPLFTGQRSRLRSGAPEWHSLASMDVIALGGDFDYRGLRTLAAHCSSQREMSRAA
jgi:hypothetical protein